MKKATTSQLSVNIRPEVDVYATYRRLSYRPWFAIAEFMDNSTQNYHEFRERLLRAYESEEPSHLRIVVEYDDEQGSLTIRDNAHGMEIEELTRALVLNRPPPNTAGRSEFGMGLKTAACWFGRTWSIDTTRLGSRRALSATVHVLDLAKNKTEEIPIDERKAAKSDHFTQITIEGLYNPIRGMTIARIRDQLRSMYREDLRSREIEISWHGAPVSFEEAPILVEELQRGRKRKWKKRIRFSVRTPDGDKLAVDGWIAIRDPARQRDAGFVLLRRQRVIVGGPGAGYKPEEVFGQGNTFRSQRLIGELHLNDWPVTQAKDAFDWSGGLEEEFIQRLKAKCQEYMDYAESYRQPPKELTATEMQLAAQPTQEVFSNETFQAGIAEDLSLPDPPKSAAAEKKDALKLKAVSHGPILFNLDVGTEEWAFRLHWQDQLSDAHWMEVSYPQDDEIDIFLNTAHPFFAPYLGDPSALELIQKLVLSLALAERIARQVSNDGRIAPGDFRNLMNRVLRRATHLEVQIGER